MNKDVIKSIEEYVYKNYKSYKDKTLIIKDFDIHYRVLKHKDGSPLILGKEVIN